MNGDQVSEITRKVVNILFVSNPKGTSLGVLVGVVLDGFLGVFSPALKAIEWINVAAIKTWHLIGLGVFSMNLPSYLKRNDIDTSIINAISFIESEKEKGNVSDWQARQMYFNLHQKVLESITLESSRQETASKIFGLSTESGSDDKSSNQRQSGR